MLSAGIKPVGMILHSTQHRFKTSDFSPVLDLPWMSNSIGDIKAYRYKIFTEHIKKDKPTTQRWKLLYSEKSD